MSSLLARITISPDICHGKPVIRNLRYPVESMLEYLAGGDTIEDLLAEFPDLEREDLLACLEFAVAGSTPSAVGSSGCLSSMRKRCIPRRFKYARDVPLFLNNNLLPIPRRWEP